MTKTCEQHGPDVVVSFEFPAVNSCPWCVQEYNGFADQKFSPEISPAQFKREVAEHNARVVGKRKKSHKRRA